MAVRPARLPYAPIRGLAEGYYPGDGFLSRAENIRLDEFGAWRPCRGTTKLFFTWYTQIDPPIPAPDPMAAVGAIETMHWFSQHQGGRQWLLWEHRTSPSSNVVDLVSFDGTNRSFKVVDAGRKYNAGPWLRTWYLAHADWLYVINGTDKPIRWNGRWSVEIGFSGPAAAPIPRYADEALIQDFIYPNWPFDAGVIFATSRETDNMNGDGRRGVGPTPPNYDLSVAKVVAAKVYWKYGYAYTYVNDQGQESPPSVMRYVTGWNVGVDVSSLAPAMTPADAGCRAVQLQMPKGPPQAVGGRLWRTKNIWGLSPETQLQAALFLHTEFACTIDTPFNDLKPDIELGRQLDPSIYGPFPKNANMMAMFCGTMFVTTTSPSSIVRRSAPGFPEQFPEDLFFELGDADSGAVTAMHATKGALVLFKNRGIYVIRQPADGMSYRVETLSEDVGCCAARALAEIPDGLLFCSIDGVFLLRGSLADNATPVKVEYIGGPVASTWANRVNKGALSVAWATVNHQDREVWIQLPEDGRSRPTFGLVYHYGEASGGGAWSTRESWEVSCMAETRDERHYLYLGRNVLPYGIRWYTDSTTLIAEAAGPPPGVDIPVGAYLKSVPFGHKGGQIYWSGADLLCIAFGSGRSVTLDPYVNRRPVAVTALSETRHLIDTEGTANNVDTKRAEWGSAVWGTDRWTDLDLTLVRFSVRPPGSPSEVQWGLSGDRFAVYGLNMNLETDEKPKTDEKLAFTGPR